MMLDSPSSNHFGETLKLLGYNLKNNKGDIEEFQNRIKTFILDQRWVGKPYVLSPPVCARYGWKCCGPDKLQCVSCAASLSTSLPQMEKCGSYDRCILNVLNSLKTAHRKHCPWPLAPCPENFFLMVPVRKEAAFESYVSRLESLLPIETFLPRVKETAADVLGLSDDDFLALYKLSHVSESPFARSAVLLAATGWRRVSDAGKKKYITCIHCQRTVGVWFYSSVQSSPSTPIKECNTKNERTSDLLTPTAVSSQPVQDDTSSSVNNSASVPCSDNVVDHDTFQNSKEIVVPKEESNDDPEPQRLQNGKRSSWNDDSCMSETQSSAKKRKLFLETNEPFDPLYEHRPWCMWVSRTATHSGVQSSEDSSMQSHDQNDVIPGYKVFIECLLRNVANSGSSPCSLSSPTKEQLSEARELLMTWSSPV